VPKGLDPPRVTSHASHASPWVAAVNAWIADVDDAEELMTQCKEIVTGRKSSPLPPKNYGSKLDGFAPTYQPLTDLRPGQRYLALPVAV